MARGLEGKPGCAAPFIGLVAHRTLCACRPTASRPTTMAAEAYKVSRRRGEGQSPQTGKGAKAKQQPSAPSFASSSAVAVLCTDCCIQRAGRPAARLAARQAWAPSAPPPPQQQQDQRHPQSPPTPPWSTCCATCAPGTCARTFAGRTPRGTPRCATCGCWRAATTSTARARQRAVWTWAPGWASGRASGPRGAPPTRRATCPTSSRWASRRLCHSTPATSSWVSDAGSG